VCFSTFAWPSLNPPGNVARSTPGRRARRAWPMGRPTLPLHVFPSAEKRPAGPRAGVREHHPQPLGLPRLLRFPNLAPIAVAAWSNRFKPLRSPENKNTISNDPPPRPRLKFRRRRVIHRYCLQHHNTPLTVAVSTPGVPSEVGATGLYHKGRPRPSTSRPSQLTAVTVVLDDLNVAGPPTPPTSTRAALSFPRITSYGPSKHGRR